MDLEAVRHYGLNADEETREKNEDVPHHGGGVLTVLSECSASMSLPLCFISAGFGMFFCNSAAMSSTS